MAARPVGTERKASGRWVAARISPSARVARARFPAEGPSSFNLLFDLADADADAADGGTVTPYVAKLGSPRAALPDVP